MGPKEQVRVSLSAAAIFIVNMGDTINIVRMLAFVISGTQTTTKSTTQLRDTIWKRVLKRQRKYSSL